MSLTLKESLSGIDFTVSCLDFIHVSETETTPEIYLLWSELTEQKQAEICEMYRKYVTLSEQLAEILQEVTDHARNTGVKQSFDYLERYSKETGTISEAAINPVLYSSI